jgi:hypothetical protein
MGKMLPVLIVLLFILAVGAIGVLAIRWTRKSSRRAALLGLGLQFLSAFVIPVPPPQVQQEEVKARARVKKDTEAGDDPNKGSNTLH